jgi:hypothetical protein
MCWNKQIWVLSLSLAQTALFGQVTQMTTHKFGAYLSSGLSTGKRILPSTIGSLSFQSPGQAISMGGSYAKNISEFVWLQTGLDINYREWKWQCNELSGNIKYPATVNEARETWLTAPLQALFYSGHEQGRLFICAGPSVSMLLHKSWQEQTAPAQNESFSSTINESNQTKSFKPGFCACIGSEIEMNPFLFCRIQLQAQKQWYKREGAGSENSSAIQLSFALIWSK